MTRSALSQTATPRQITRIENLSYLVTVDEDFTILQDATIEFVDGVLTVIGDRRGPGRADDRAAAAVGERLAEGAVDGRPAGAGDDVDDVVTVIDGRGRLAMPGLINLHTHLPMTLLRGLAENVDLQGFLATVWAAEGAVMDPDTVRLGAELGALESVSAGCTTQLDMYFHHEQAHEGALLVGSRHVGGPVLFDGLGPDGLTWAERLEHVAAWPSRLTGPGPVGAKPVVPAAVMPHATYTCSPEHLRELADVVAGWPSHVRPLVHIHASENAAENTDVVRRYGMTPVQILADVGLLGGAPRVVLGHGVHLDARDRALVAGAQPGAAVAHCPGSNLKLASGAMPWQTCRDAGVRVGLGTDGCASSNDLDLWAVMRQAALVARLTSGDPRVAPAVDLVRAATTEGARALGMADLIGSLEVGKRADLILLDLDAPHLTPVHDVAALLVFAAGRGDVTDVFVDGRPVIRNRRSTLVDTEDLLSRVRTRATAAAAAARAVRTDEAAATSSSTAGRHGSGGAR